MHTAVTVGRRTAWVAREGRGSLLCCWAVGPAPTIVLMPCGGIHPVVVPQRRIERRVVFRQAFRLFAEGLCGHGEELAGVLGAVVGHDRRLPARRLIAQGPELAAQHFRPHPVTGYAVEHGRPVYDPVLLVQLVGELMEDDVLTLKAIPCITLHLVPGDDHPAHLPGLPDTRLTTSRTDPRLVYQLAVDDEGRRVDQDRLELSIVIGLAVQYEKTGLRGDEHPYRFTDLQPTTAVEALLGEEDRDMSPEFLPQELRHLRVEAQPFEQDSLPLRGKRGPLQALAAPSLEHRRAEQEGGQQCAHEEKWDQRFHTGTVNDSALALLGSVHLQGLHAARDREPGVRAAADHVEDVTHDRRGEAMPGRR